MNESIKLTFVLLVFLTGCDSAPDVKADKELNLTTTPVMQTAEWAEKMWLSRHEAKVARAKQGNVDLIMVGDSITRRWTDYAEDNWNRYYGHRNAVNLGFSGDRTEHLLWRLQNGEVDGISPKVAVLMIGTNNTGKRQNPDPPQETLQGIQAVLNELRQRLPDTKILLLAITPRGATADNWMRIANEEINKELPSYADNKNIFFLNINENFVSADGQLSEELIPDELHPSAQGYEVWAAAMEPTLSRLMGE